MQKIILASQSPRRKQLLEWAEVPFEIIIQSTNESYPADLPVTDIAIHIARNKALAVQQSNQFNIPILAADTIVVLNNEVIGKPKDRADAIAILSKLSAQKHTVITGVVILHNDKEIAFADTTAVEFHALTLEQIIFYVDKYKPYDKAGAYAIQEWIGVIGIKSVNGDFYNVMGTTRKQGSAGIIAMLNLLCSLVRVYCTHINKINNPYQDRKAAPVYLAISIF